MCAKSHLQLWRKGSARSQELEGSFPESVVPYQCFRSMYLIYAVAGTVAIHFLIP